MTTGHSPLYDYNNNDNYDPILAQFSSFGISDQHSCSFSLASWNDNGSTTTAPTVVENEEDETDNDEDNNDGWDRPQKITVVQEDQSNGQPSTAAAQGISPPSCYSRPVLCITRKQNTRVRFMEEPEVRCYEQVGPECFGLLYYSCHELQKIRDEMREEQQQENCSGTTAISGSSTCVLED